MPPTNPTSRPLGQWPAAALAGFAISAVGLLGCGGDSDSERATTEVPAAQRTADARVVQALPFGSTTDQVVAQIGKPARIEDARGVVLKKESERKSVAPCYVYGVAGGDPDDLIRLCFLRGKLQSVLSAARTNPTP